MTRIDVYLDGRPVATRDIKAVMTSLTLADVSPGPHTLKVQGFAGNQLVVAQTNPLA